MKAIVSWSSLFAALLLLAPHEAFSQGGTRNVSGFAFVDADGDGEYDEDEEILVGVEVFLLDADGNVIATTTSGEDGTYSFPNVPFGDDYSILVKVDQNTFAESPAFNVGPGDGQIAIPLPVNEQSSFIAPSTLLTAIQEFKQMENSPSNPKNQVPVSPFVP